jgi:hypothetical protein
VSNFACASPRSVDAMLAYAEAEAENLIRENLNVVLALVDALVISPKGKLTGVDVDRIIASAISIETLATEIERRAKWADTLFNAAGFTDLRRQSCV